MTRSRGISSIIGLFALLLTFATAAAVHAQAPRPVNFLATHYDVSATIDAIGQSLSASAKIDLVATEASSNVRVELRDGSTGSIVTSSYTGMGGGFAFQNVPQGNYSVVASTGTQEAEERVAERFEALAGFSQFGA